MRSSVCALNAASGDNFNMNFPDYEQTTGHHSTLLVLIRGIGVICIILCSAADNQTHFSVHSAEQTPDTAKDLRENPEGQQCQD